MTQGFTGHPKALGEYVYGLVDRGDWGSPVNTRPKRNIGSMSGVERGSECIRSGSPGAPGSDHAGACRSVRDRCSRAAELSP